MADNKRGRGDRDKNQENPNECKSAKAIKLLREVTSLLSEGDSNPDQPAAEQIRQAHGQVGASGSLSMGTHGLHFLRDFFANLRFSDWSYNSLNMIKYLK